VRLLGALLGQAGTATPEQVAGRAGVSTEAAAETLAALEREGLLERMPGEAYRATRLDSREVRELYPAVLMLEAIAVLRPARRALMPYERVYMDTGERRERSAHSTTRSSRRWPAATRRRRPSWCAGTSRVRCRS